MALIAEYFEQTNKYLNQYGFNTVVLMQVGVFFEVYGLKDQPEASRIAEFAQICELSVAEKNICVGKSNVLIAGFKDIMLDKYMKKLHDAGFTVAVYTQDGIGKNPTRSLTGIFSPGTYFQPESTKLTNSISCIWVDYFENTVYSKGKHVVIGIANIDIYTGKTTLFQCNEVYLHNPTTYDELERFISIHQPSEVILLSNLPNAQELDSVLTYAGIECTTIHKIHITETMDATRRTQVRNCEKQSYQKEILSRFYSFDDFHVFFQNFYENHLAAQACCFLLDFIFVHNPPLVSKLAEPVFENVSTRLSLANHSLKQLNILPDGTVSASSKLSSVSTFLNQCMTPMGRRTFLHNLLNPTCDEKWLQREYDITSHLLEQPEEQLTLWRTKMGCIKDIAKLERQLLLKKIAPKSVASLYSSIRAIGELFELASGDAVTKTYIHSNNDKVVVGVGDLCREVLAFFDAQVDVEAMTKDELETNFIRRGVNAELDQASDLLQESEGKLEAIRDCLNKLISMSASASASSSSADFVKIYETEKNNYSLICTIRRGKLLQDALPSTDTSFLSGALTLSKSKVSLEKQSSSNLSIVSPQILQVCRTIYSAKTNLKDFTAEAYRRFIEQLSGNYLAHLDRIIEFIVSLDMICTKAWIAKQYHYCRPDLRPSEKAFVKATGLRHCLVEQFRRTEELYVSNDLSLGINVVNGILLYGTNAVGKTTLIRALGIAVIMAQAGLFVPCTTFQFQPYKRLFTRILGNDNLFKGMSTFEVEMSELRTILRLADENSLILGDELCSGTETVSATSIFVAGIQTLHQRQSSFIFATHLHEITDYEEITQLPTVCLKHMEVKYDRERDRLVYDRKIRDGAGSHLYGLEVCKSLNLPRDFLEAANNIRLKYHPEGRSIFLLKRSRYNADKIVGICEKCGIKMGTEVHHLRHQAEANEAGIIQTDDLLFHKNHVANLMTLCEKCHLDMHRKI